MDLQEYKIKNSIKCDCGYEFTIRDMTELKRINDNKFYGGNIKHISETHCPICLRETILLLKQVGQTYKVIDIAQKDKQIFKDNAEQMKVDSNESNTDSNERTCPNCKKVFKTKQGLAVHSKTCGK